MVVTEQEGSSLGRQTPKVDVAKFLCVGWSLRGRMLRLKFGSRRCIWTFLEHESQCSQSFHIILIGFCRRKWPKIQICRLIPVRIFSEWARLYKVTVKIVQFCGDESKCVYDGCSTTSKATEWLRLVRAVEVC